MLAVPRHPQSNSRRVWLYFTTVPLDDVERFDQVMCCGCPTYFLCLKRSRKLAEDLSVDHQQDLPFETLEEA